MYLLCLTQYNSPGSNAVIARWRALRIDRSEQRGVDSAGATTRGGSAPRAGIAGVYLGVERAAEPRFLRTTVGAARARDTTR